MQGCIISFEYPGMQLDGDLKTPIIHVGGNAVAAIGEENV